MLLIILCCKLAGWRTRPKIRSAERRLFLELPNNEFTAFPVLDAPQSSAAQGVVLPNRLASRCTSGNQSLAFALAGAIGEPTIQLKAPVASIDLSGRSANVALQSGRVLEADAVVLTAPPSTWHELGITPALPESYRMSTGSAIKVLCRVDRPFCISANLEPESLSDQSVGMTWQGVEPATPVPKGPACLTVFAGGKAAQAWAERNPPARKDLANNDLDQLFPGFSSHSEQQIFCGWPAERWTRCGYSAPAQGEVTRVFPLLERGWRDKLFFAGE